MVEKNFFFKGIELAFSNGKINFEKKYNTKYNDLQFKSKLIYEFCEDIGIKIDENIEKNQWIPYIYINKLHGYFKNKKIRLFLC